MSVSSPGRSPKGGRFWAWPGVSCTSLLTQPCCVSGQHSGSLALCVVAGAALAPSVLAPSALTGPGSEPRASRPRTPHWSPAVGQPSASLHFSLPGASVSLPPAPPLGAPQSQPCQAAPRSSGSCSPPPWCEAFRVHSPGRPRQGTADWALTPQELTVLWSGGWMSETESQRGWLLLRPLSVACRVWPTLSLWAAWGVGRAEAPPRGASPPANLLPQLERSWWGGPGGSPGSDSKLSGFSKDKYSYRSFGEGAVSLTEAGENSGWALRPSTVAVVPVGADWALGGKQLDLGGSQRKPVGCRVPCRRSDVGLRLPDVRSTSGRTPA